jgi:hypothetical protein
LKEEIRRKPKANNKERRKMKKRIRMEELISVTVWCLDCNWKIGQKRHRVHESSLTMRGRM